MKYEQEDLLEKFIQNEKKSKFWALLSAVAFTLVAVTVVYVAKEVKGGSGNDDNASLRQDNAGLRQEVDRLNVQFEILNNKLKEYEGKLNPPKVDEINILIKYDSIVSYNTVDRLQSLLSKYVGKINFSTEMVQEKFEPEVKYFSSDDGKRAEYISSIINDPSYFASQIKCKTTFISDGSKTAGSFEIWLIYIN